MSQESNNVEEKNRTVGIINERSENCDLSGGNERLEMQNNEQIEIELGTQEVELDRTEFREDQLQNNRRSPGLEVRECNCRKKAECPLQNKCLTRNIVYLAKVTSEGKEFRYIGATSCEFKSRWRNHLQSFRKEKYETSHILSRLGTNIGGAAKRI